jgi:hypothetical protein
LGKPDQGQSKKLEAAARFWAGERTQPVGHLDEHVIQGLISAGAPDDVIELARSKIKSGSVERFEVYEENWETVLFFLALKGQWRVISGMSVFYQDIDHTAIFHTMEMLGTPKRQRKQLFLDVKLMAAAALEVLNIRKD